MPGMPGTMREWKAGTLHSGSQNGPVVKNQKQAVAIGLNQERKLRRPTRSSARRMTRG